MLLAKSSLLSSLINADYFTVQAHRLSKGGKINDAIVFAWAIPLYGIPELAEDFPAIG